MNVDELKQLEGALEDELRGVRAIIRRLEAQGLVAPPRGGRFSERSIPESAEILLREHGPLKTREVADLLKAGGKETRAQGWIQNVYTILQQKETKFLRLPDKRWGLLDPEWRKQWAV